MPQNKSAQPLESTWQKASAAHSAAASPWSPCQNRHSLRPHPLAPNAARPRQAGAFAPWVLLCVAASACSAPAQPQVHPPYYDLAYGLSDGGAPSAYALGPYSAGGSQNPNGEVLVFQGTAWPVSTERFGPGTGTSTSPSAGSPLGPVAGREVLSPRTDPATNTADASASTPQNDAHTGAASRQSESDPTGADAGPGNTTAQQEGHGQANTDAGTETSGGDPHGDGGNRTQASSGQDAHTTGAQASRSGRHARRLNARQRRALRALVARRPRGQARGHEQASLESAVALEDPDGETNENENDTENTSPAPDEPLMFYSIPIVGKSIVLVVDVSYSMREEDPHVPSESVRSVVPSKLDMLRIQLVKLLAVLPPDRSINVIAFSSRMTMMFPSLQHITPETLEEGIRWTASLSPQDETHPLQALRAANLMGPEQIICLTDGRPTYADQEEPALLDYVPTLTARGARLDLVGIGSDQNASFLDTLAARAHGVAVHL